MNLRLACTILLTTPILWLSCNTEEKGTKQNLGYEEILAKRDSLHYQVKYFKDFSPYFSKTEEGIDSTYFEGTFPVFTDSINEMVKEAIFINGEKDIYEVSDNFISAFNEFAEDVINNPTGYYGAWFLKQDCRIELNNGYFLTLVNNISEYTGGAHGMEVELWYNYDLEQSKKLKLEDIIQDSVEFRKLVERHFRKHENLTDTSTYGGNYFFSKGEFILADNFGFNKEGLIFHYNVYEIKAYADGPTTLLIPYEDLDGFLTETGNRLRNSVVDIR